jgi:trk system potassium uptake protein
MDDDAGVRRGLGQGVTAGSSPRARARARSGFQHPGRVLAVSFLGAIAVGSVLLSLPAATATGERPTLLDAVFTATSAVCVTGLVTVDTGSYWSLFGQVVILVLIQVGGLG